jgi:D-aspartate ligase
MRKFSKGPAALVLNAGYAGLAAIRGLGRAGVEVHAMDHTYGPGLASRYAVATTICPDPLNEDSELLQTLLEYRTKFAESPVVYPASDAFFEFVSNNRDALSPLYRLALPPASLSAAAIDKRKQYELAAATGIPFPRTVYPATFNDVREVMNSIVYPVFIKPIVGHTWRRHFLGKGFLIENSSDLLATYLEILPTGLETMIQSYIVGPPTDMHSVALYRTKDGRYLGHFVARKIRQSGEDAGVGTLMESCNDEELVDMSIRFVNAMNYHGIAELEFKRDSRDGIRRLIELNPRLWLQAQLASDAGVNFAKIQYNDLTDRAPDPVFPSRKGFIWLDWVADYQSCRLAHKKGQLSLYAWLRSWISARSYATFAGDDPRPFYVSSRPAIQGMLKNAMARIRRLCGLK